MFSQQYSIKALAVFISIFSVSVDAHMMMASPVPYGKSTLDNSPLAADGSNFPCKLRSNTYALEGASNVMAIGEPQTLSFIGSAVHGGGSCQVSLTTDAAPDKNSKWMVIKSIEGGCPADVPGNLPDDASGTGAATFQYSVPEGIAPGQYTIAWSWVNKIGNREFYMNCGPATVTAAKKKRYAPAPPTSEKRDTSFPAMFVANLAGVSNNCATVETVDTLYPDPGSVVQQSSDGKFGPPVGCTGTEAASSGSGSGNSTESSGTPVASAPASPASSAAGSPGVFASGAASASGGTPAVTSTAVVSPIPAATGAAPPAASSASPASSGTATGGGMSGACTDEGEWYCSADGSSFQRCASGAWSQSISMAAGTKCTPGLSDSLNMTAGKNKRGEHTNHVRRGHRVRGDSSR